jgi:hypothetical protein
VHHGVKGDFTASIAFDTFTFTGDAKASLLLQGGVKFTDAGRVPRTGDPYAQNAAARSRGRVSTSTARTAYASFSDCCRSVA